MWTKIAEPYPRPLCIPLARAQGAAAGWLLPQKAFYSTLGYPWEGPAPSKRHGTAAALRATTRQALPLREVGRVEPATAKGHSVEIQRFLSWVQQASPASFEDLGAAPALLDALVASFLHHLYEAGHPLYNARLFITGIQGRIPELRRRLPRAWDVVTAWEWTEPVVHRKPVPLALYRALVVIGLSWGWFRWAGCVMAIFQGITRPMEVLQATRAQLVLPRDQVFPKPLSKSQLQRAGDEAPEPNMRPLSRMRRLNCLCHLWRHASGSAPLRRRR